MRTFVYVDAFNLYYGILRAPGRRRLDLVKLSQALLPKDEIVKVKYFTALVRAPSWDPQVATRQQTYLRALHAARVEVVLGRYAYRTKRARKAAKPNDPVQILHVEEKGSDVNLASHLLLDGFRNEYDKAVVVSNDSDLTVAVRMVRDNLNHPVMVVNPHPPQKRSAHLNSAASESRQLRKGVVKRCQFPDTLADSTGTFTKPKGW